MKTILAAALAAGSMLILPVAAATPAAAVPVDITCPAGTAAGPFTVYTGPGFTGAGLAGVCSPEIGYLEVGATYVVAQSKNVGYVGLSSYESRTHRCQTAPANDADEGGSGTNGGGCYGTNQNFVDLRTGAIFVAGQPVASLPVGVPQAAPLPVCGDGTGPFISSSRDGCRAEAEDVDQFIRDLV